MIDNYADCNLLLFINLLLPNSNVMENVSTLSKVVSAVSQSKNSKSQSSSYADIKDPKKRYFAVIQHEK